MDSEISWIEKLGRLNEENLRHFLRFLTLLVEHDDFYNAYHAFLEKNGGMEVIGVSGVDHFMDEWEKNLDSKNQDPHNAKKAVCL